MLDDGSLMTAPECRDWAWRLVAAGGVELTLLALKSFSKNVCDSTQDKMVVMAIMKELDGPALQFPKGGSS
jgi:hypothetical protein